MIEQGLAMHTIKDEQKGYLNVNQGTDIIISNVKIFSHS